MKADGPGRISGVISHDRAEALAIAALSFLAADADRLDRFMALSGLNPESLRQAAATAGFLPAVLAHLAGDERLVVAFSASYGCDPSSIIAAHAALAPHDDSEV
jgi:hypothetical protein